MSGPEDNPRDDVPVDKDSYEKWEREQMSEWEVKQPAEAGQQLPCREKCPLCGTECGCDKFHIAHQCKTCNSKIAGAAPETPE